MELQELKLYSKVYENEFEDNIITLDLINFEDMIRFRKWKQFRPIPNDYLSELLGFQHIGERTINDYEKENRYSLHNVIDGSSSFILALKHSTYGGEDYWEWVVYIDNEQIYTYQEIAYIHQVQELYYILTGNILN